MNRSYERRPEKWPKPAVLPSLELRQPTPYFEADLPLKLRQSKYMLVVPNRHTSVYTRLWCGYEAYLGFAYRILVGGFGTCILFFHILGIIIPTDELIFFRGLGQPPTRKRFESIEGNFLWVNPSLGESLEGVARLFLLVSTNRLNQSNCRWYPLLTLWLFNIAMENGPFIDGLPIKSGDFPWLC